MEDVQIGQRYYLPAGEGRTTEVEVENVGPAGVFLKHWGGSFAMNWERFLSAVENPWRPGVKIG